MLGLGKSLEGSAMCVKSYERNALGELTSIWRIICKEHGKSHGHWSRRGDFESLA